MCTPNWNWQPRGTTRGVGATSLFFVPCSLCVCASRQSLPKTRFDRRAGNRNVNVKNGWHQLAEVHCSQFVFFELFVCSCFGLCQMESLCLDHSFVNFFLSTGSLKGQQNSFNEPCLWNDTAQRTRLQNCRLRACRSRCAFRTWRALYWKFGESDDLLVL